MLIASLRLASSSWFHRPTLLLELGGNWKEEFSEEVLSELSDSCILFLELLLELDDLAPPKL